MLDKTIAKGSMVAAMWIYARILVLLGLAAVVLLGRSPSARADDWTPLWTTAGLSQARSNLAGVSAGNEALFAGGYVVSSFDASNVVDIYNATSNSWLTASLTAGARYTLGAAAADGKVVFGGGWANGGDTAAVDIYDTADNAWSTAGLSQARYDLAAAAANGKVFLGGGEVFTYPSTYSASQVVDIYDAGSNQWSTAALSQGRYDLAAASVGNTVLFAGGFNSSGLPSAAVNVCNAASGAWSTASLSQARGYLAAASVGNEMFFAGGFGSASVPSNVVDIYDASAGTWSTAALSQRAAGRRPWRQGPKSSSRAASPAGIPVGRRAAWWTSTTRQRTPGQPPRSRSPAFAWQPRPRETRCSSREVGPTPTAASWTSIRCKTTHPSAVPKLGRWWTIRRWRD